MLQVLRGALLLLGVGTLTIAFLYAENRFALEDWYCGTTGAYSIVSLIPLLLLLAAGAGFVRVIQTDGAQMYWWFVGAFFCGALAAAENIANLDLLAISGPWVVWLYAIGLVCAGAIFVCASFRPKPAR